MLRQLQVQDYALITSLELEFEPGLTVLTGETGAGKSIILDAIAMLTGSRAYTEAIRTGAETAWLAATFDITGLDDLLRLLPTMGFEAENQELTIAREIHRSGRNKCWVNGRLATVAALREIGAFLVEIHGQAEHQAVFEPHRYLEMLDALGGPSVAAVRREVEVAYAKVQDLEAELGRLTLSEQERLRQIDLLQFQFDEIATAGLTPGEETGLRQEREILRHSERLREAVTLAYQILYGQDVPGHGVLDRLGEVVSLLEPLVTYDERLTTSLQMLEAANANAGEAMWDLRQYAEGLGGDPERLGQVEERLSLIHRLERKYGETTEAILAYHAKIEKELAELLDSEVRVEAMEKDLVQARAKLADLAGKLSNMRKQVAKELERKLMAELPDLNLPHARFEIRIRQIASEGGIPYPDRSSSSTVQVNSRGVDYVEFYFSANPGEEVKPLARVVSGGEASRLMLALKSVIAATDGVPTLIFDEVDAGIGGKTARAIGAKLAALANERQVLCVTHLAQVAGAADHHLAIAKDVTEQSTAVRVEVLEQDARVGELARMLAGDGASEVSRQHARQLLAERISS